MPSPKVSSLRTNIFSSPDKKFFVENSSWFKLCSTTQSSFLSDQDETIIELEFIKLLPTSECFLFKIRRSWIELYYIVEDVKWERFKFRLSSADNVKVGNTENSTLQTFNKSNKKKITFSNFLKVSQGEKKLRQQITLKYDAKSTFREDTNSPPASIVRRRNFSIMKIRKNVFGSLISNFGRESSAG